MQSHRVKRYQLDVDEPLVQLVKEQQRTNLLLELQCDLLIHLVNQKSDGAEFAMRLDKIMEQA